MARDDKLSLRGRLEDEARLDQAIATEEQRAQQRKQRLSLRSEQPSFNASVEPRPNRQPSFNPAPAPGTEPEPLSLNASVGDVDELDINQFNRSRNTFQQGLAQGMQNLRATVPATLSIAGGLVGAEDFAVEQAERAQEIVELGGKLGPQTSFQGVLDGDVGFGDYLAGLAGTQAPNLASIAIGGGIAGLAGKALGKAAVSGAVRTVGEAAGRREGIRLAQRAAIDKIKAQGGTVSRSQAGRLGQATTQANIANKDLGTVLARQRQLTDRGANIGTALGAGSSIAASVAPETTDIILDEEAGSIQQRALAAAGGAVSAAAINTLPVMRLFRRIGLGKTTERMTRQLAERKGLLRRASTEVPTQALFEGGTEVAEGIIIGAAHRLLNENVEIFSDESIAGMIEEFAAGALLGAGGGVVSASAMTIRQPAGPTEAAMEERTAAKQLAGRKNAVNFLDPTEQHNRQQPTDVRIDRAIDGFAGKIAMEENFGEVSSFGEAQEIGQAFRVLLDPDVEADTVIQDEQGNEITAADAAVRTLEERFGINVADNLELMRQAFAQGEQFQIDRLAAALDERAAIEEIEGTVPEGAPGSEEFRLNRQVLNEELAFRQERLQDILREGVPTVEETLDPDAALDRQERRIETAEEVEAEQLRQEQQGVDNRGDALQEVPASARPVLNEEQGSTPPITLKANQGLKGSRILGRIFVGERTPEAGKSQGARLGAQRVVDQLNTETGSAGRFEVRPAGDVLVRELNSRAGRDDSETAANSPEIQSRVVAEAQRVAEANPRITEGNRLQGEDFQSALRFLNQFDTVVEEQQVSALTGADSLTLTPDQLRTDGIVQAVPDGRPLEANELQVTGPDGEPAVVNLVPLTRTLIGRLRGEGLAGRGGTQEQRQQRGRDYEQQGGSGVSRENIGRAVASGLAEILTRNGFRIGPDQQALDATLQRLGEVQGEIETQRASEQPVDQELIDEAAQLEQAIATEMEATLESVLRDDAVAFRARGGAETTVGGSNLRGEAALRAEINNATRILPVKRRLKELTEARDAIPKTSKKQAAQRERLTGLIKDANQKLRKLRGSRLEKRKVDSGKTKAIKPRVKQLQRRIDALRELLGADIKRHEFRTALDKAIRKALGFPSLNGIRTERLSIISAVDPNAAPTLPVVEGNEKNIAKDQAKADKAAELAKAKGGQAKFIGRGSPRSSTNLYSTVYGPRANSGTYSANDAVFLSVEGKRGGSLGFEASRAEVKRAINAGADIITDSPKNREGNAKENAKRKKRLAGITAEIKAVRAELEKSRTAAETTRKAIKETLTPAEASEAAGPNVSVLTQMADANRQITGLLDARTSAELDAKLLVNMPDLTVAARRKQMKGIVDKLAEIDSTLQAVLDEKAQLADQLVEGHTGTPGPAAAALRRAKAQLNRLERTNKVLAQRLEALAKKQAEAEADVDFNTGERAAADFLREQGYVENEQGGLSVWSRRRNDVPQSEPATTPEPEPVTREAPPQISDKEFSEFRDVPERMTAQNIAKIKKARQDSARNATPEGRREQQTAERMAEKLIREQKVTAKQAIKTVNEIFDIVDEFSAAFNVPPPNVVLALKSASNGGTYLAETNTVVLNINNLGKGGLSTQNRQTIVHELAHSLEFESLVNATKEEQAALIKEFNDWRAQAKKRIDAATTSAQKQQVLEALISEKRGQPTGISKDLKKAEAYVLSPREWFADNAARLIIEGSTNGVNAPLALAVFKRLAADLKKLFQTFFAKKTPSTPELRKFLINMRNAANPELDAAPSQQDFKVPEKKLTEAEQARLKELEAAEQRMQERLVEMEQLRKLVDEAGTSNTVQVLEAQVRLLQLLQQSQITRRREAEALNRTQEQRQAEIARRDEQDRRVDERAGDSLVDNPTAQEEQDAALPSDRRATPPPWLDTKEERDSFNPPSDYEIRNEQNRLMKDLEDAGVEGLSVRIVDWAEAGEIFDSALAKGKTLENIESLSRVKDGEITIWVNETINDSPSSRRAALNNEVARGVLLQQASQLDEAQAANVLEALGFNGGKAQLMKVLQIREGSLGALRSQPRRQMRMLYEKLSGKVSAPGKNAFFKDVRKLMKGLIKATDSTLEPEDLVRDIPRVTGRVSETEKFSSTWAETKAKVKILNPQSNVNKATKAALEGEARPANKKKRPPEPPTKPPPPAPPQEGSGGSGDGGGRSGPPQAPASPDDAFGAYFMLGDTFTVQGFYAARDLINAKLTTDERNILARAFQSLPVRRQMLDFLKAQGVTGNQREVFIDDPVNQIALGYQLFAAGELKLEESPSKVMKGLNSFAHKVMGTLKTSEQAVEIMAALSDARIEARQSRLHREAKKGSFLAAGEYALSSADLTTLYDMLESNGLFKAKKLKSANEKDLRDMLDADPTFMTLPKTVQQRIAKDIKAGVFTEKFTSTMAQLNDFTLNPDAQFEVQKIVGNNKLQKAARAIAAGIKFLGPVGRLVVGEAMRARFTGNAAIIDFMNSIMTDVTSQGRATSMINAKQQRKAQFDSDMQIILNRLTDEQQVELMEVMQDQNAKSKDPDVIAAREEFAKLTVRMRNYAVRAGLQIGDKGRDYVPLVFDPETTAKKAEDLIEDWMRPRFKAGWEALARERGKIKPGEKMSEADRRQMVIQTVNAIATENNGLVDSAGLDETNATESPPRVNAMNKRDLAFIEEQGDAASTELLASVRSKDLNGTYAVYISQLVKRAEYARTFGAKGEKFKRQVKRARELGATQDDIDLMNNIAASALGRIGLEVAPVWKALMKPIEAAFQKPLLAENGKPFPTAEAASKAKKAQGVKGRVIEAPQGGGFIVDRAITNDPVRFRQAMSWMVTYQNFRILSMAAFTNVADLAGLVFRTGSVGTAMKGYQAGLSDVMSSIQNRKLPRKEKAAQMSELRNLAQDLGIIEFGVISDILGQAYGNNHLSGTAKRWNDKFFRWNGMEHLTRTTRLAALASGRAYLVQKARQAAEGDKSAIQELAELDLDVTDLTVENGQLVLLSQDEVNSVLDPMGLTSADIEAQTLGQQQFEALSEGKEKARQRQLRRLARDERAKRALVRMVDETVLRPNATQRATWMNNPNWQVFSHLKGFLYTYQERVLRRGYTQASQGNYGPMLQMSSYVGMIMAMDLLREFVQHGPGGDERKEEWTFGDRLGDGFRRSGVAGVGTFFMDMQQANQFGSSMFFEAAGPTVSQIGQLQRAFISGRANKATAIKRSIPGSQLAIDAPINYMDYFLDSTLDLSLSDPRTVQTLSDSPIASRDLRRDARALLFRQ